MVKDHICHIAVRAVALLLLLIVPKVAEGAPSLQLALTPSSLTANAGDTVTFVGKITNTTGVPLHASEMFLNFSGFDPVALPQIGQLLGAPDFVLPNNTRSQTTALFTLSISAAAPSGTYTVQVSLQDVNDQSSETVTASVEVTGVSDTTPPVLVSGISGTLGTNGWYTSDVVVSWSVNDPESGIASSTGCSATTLTANSGGVTLTCTATNGAGLVGSASITIKIDKTAPAIQPLVVGTLGANGWYTSNVGVSWSVDDVTSGIAGLAGCSESNLTTGTSGVTLTCSAANGAGLTNSASVSVKIDQTRPVISGLPSGSCSLWPPNHQLVQVATVTAVDNGSGMASFTVAGISNEPSDPVNPDILIGGQGLGPRVVRLRAERLGSGNGRVYTLTATATNVAGLTTSVTSTCLVPHDQGR